jgi:hypothetical protein
VRRFGILKNNPWNVRFKTEEIERTKETTRWTIVKRLNEYKYYDGMATQFP